MIWQLDLILISMSIIITYIGYMINELGYLPDSISQSFYLLKYKWIFSVAMLLTAALLMPAAIESGLPESQWSAFLSCTGMIFVAFAPNFRDNLSYEVHMIGAVVCVTVSQIWVSYNYIDCLWSWLVYLIYTLIYMTRSDENGFLNKFLSTKPLSYIEFFALFNVYLTEYMITR